jgi:effector-binding domain-containing protein
MPIAPVVVERSDQPYVAITSTVSMQEMGELLPPLTDDLFAWTAEAGLAPTGPVFWKYNTIDMPAALEIEVGVPVDRLVSGSGEINSGVLPAGRYALAHHVGHPDTLEQATGELLAWAEAEGVTWDVTEVDGKERWTARLEEYLSDPAEEPDLNAWQTDLVFRLAD